MYAQAQPEVSVDLACPLQKRGTSQAVHHFNAHYEGSDALPVPALARATSDAALALACASSLARSFVRYSTHVLRSPLSTL